MKSVMFTFGENSTEASQNQLKEKISKFPGVQNVGRILPDAKMPALRRQWYAEVADDAAANSLVTHLRKHDDIQSADKPADRGLV
jgi:hypothetical protein